MAKRQQNKRCFWHRFGLGLDSSTSTSPETDLTSGGSGKRDTLDLIVPIYIDTNALLDLLASMEDGFSVVERVTTRSGATRSTDQSATVAGGTEFGIPNVLNLLKIDVRGTKTWEKSAEAGEERQSERYHTYGSLLHRLRANLFDEGLVRCFDGTTESWNKIQPSDFVELRGVFRPNPLAESLAVIDRLIRLYQLTTSVQMSPSGGKKGGGKKGSGQKMQGLGKQLEQIRSFFKGIRSDLERGETRIFVIDLSRSETHRAVALLFTEYLRDRSMTELAHKEYRVLGKVVRSLNDAEGESIDLLRGSALGGIGDDAVNDLVSSLNELAGKGYKLPEVQTSISAPALQVVPVAIYV